jgi:hypothetical protein
LRQCVEDASRRAAQALRDFRVLRAREPLVRAQVTGAQLACVEHRRKLLYQRERREPRRFDVTRPLGDLLRTHEVRPRIFKPIQTRERTRARGQTFGEQE